jgi:hypothetical protein
MLERLSVDPFRAAVALASPVGNPQCNRLFGKDRISNQDPLNFIEGYLVLPPVIEAGRPRAFVIGHRLRNLRLPAVAQVLGDSCCPEGVTADAGPYVGFGRSADA